MSGLPNGSYVTILYEEREYLFLRCPRCGYLSQIPGKKKPKKLYTCFVCAKFYSEP